MAERVSVLLRRSMDQLSADVPESYRLLLQQLGSLVVALKVDGEHFSLSGGQRIAVTDGIASTAGAEITTSRNTILDVLDARLGLRDAVEDGKVSVVGPLDDVLRLHDTLLAYVHAAIRAPSQPELLGALRAEPT
jgi:hypothetical protein